MSDVQVWRYKLPSIREPVFDSWSVVFIDSTGVFSVVSDYGNWAYWWTSFGDDIRKFLTQCDSDYVGRKLGGADLRVFDGEETQKEVRKEICRARREGELDRYRAREEWDNAGIIDDEYTFQQFLEDTGLDDLHECARMRWDHGIKHWSHVSFPRLQELLRKELGL